jgi:Carboxypeptidase regulatory-like domain/TonB dependent receptor
MKNGVNFSLFAAPLLALAMLPCAMAQETTAGLVGTVKDPSGGSIAKATVEVVSPALIGIKKAETDTVGYFRFTNLPPGMYTVTVTATGFHTYKDANVELSVGHLPELSVVMQVGAVTETVEVAAQASLVDPTQSKVQTNIPTRNLMDLPTQSLSFQSVIQFAPGARTEPLQNGYQINGASNSENSYLVEGQETASMLDGHSQANVPMDFIQEVQVKTNGFEAEYGGALGGVVNVIQKSGSNEVHGSIFNYYRSDRFDAAPNPTQLRNPQWGANANGAPKFDQPQEYYYPTKDHYRIEDPGFTLGGPIVKDRLWFFLSGAPDFNDTRRTVNFANGFGPRTFNDNISTYNALARLDFLATQKIRLHGSWQYGYTRGTGTSIPQADEVHNQFNTSSTNNPDIYNGGIGYVQPSVIYSVGADVTLTPSLVATTRFGYWAYDGTPESRGLPSGIRYSYQDTNYPYTAGNAPALAGTKALNGAVLPSQFVNSAGYSNIGGNSATVFDWWRRWNFNQDLSYFKNWHGTHNLKFGYGFMHGTADELAGAYNTADVYVAYGVQYAPNSQIGIANCQNIVKQNQAQYGVPGGNANGTGCEGLWGTVNVRDLISASGKVGGWNHSFYVQDAWTVGKRLTLNLGLRMDKENLPSYGSLPGFQGISFGWGDKMAPRLGAAYDVLGNGKVKVYGSFGYFFDIMKYNLPQGSFGGAYWHDCVYALDSPDYTGIVPQRDSQGHYCPTGGGNTQAVGSYPNMRFIENYDYREPANDPNQIGSLGKTGLVDPNLKPMKQHVWTFGGAWEIKNNLVFEPIYTRSRLDRTIEDSGVITPDGEVYYIVNPGFGVNSQVPSCPACPTNPKAVRDYDGVELRLTKRFSDKWFGSFSYTYSRLYGNYTGLTATDVSDGVGRNGANTDRAFDEPFMSFDAHGNAINGPLPTDRPNTFKANVFYNPKYKWFNPTIGLFEQAYSGTPLSSYISVWGAPVFVEGRGKFVPLTRDNATGNWVAGTPTDARTPRFTQTDVSMFQDFHVSKANERLVARLGGDCINCFNQHSVTIVNQNMIRTSGINPYQCGTAGVSCTTVTDQNAGFNYASVLKGYDYLGLANSQGRTLSSLYGQPMGWQNKRYLRLQVRFTF